MRRGTNLPEISEKFLNRYKSILQQCLNIERSILSGIRSKKEVDAIKSVEIE